jgi:hypothetical protein
MMSDRSRSPTIDANVARGMSDGVVLFAAMCFPCNSVATQEPPLRSGHRASIFDINC